MSKKKKTLIKIATLLLAYAPIALIDWTGSLFWIGEPRLPEKMLKEDNQIN